MSRIKLDKTHLEDLVAEWVDFQVLRDFMINLDNNKVVDLLLEIFSMNLRNFSEAPSRADKEVLAVDKRIKEVKTL